jgi:hypothetical protein
MHLKSGLRKLSKTFRRWYNRQAMRKTLKNPLYDPMKVKYFSVPVYWHKQAINQRWIQAEKDFQKDLTKSAPISDFAFQLIAPIAYGMDRFRHFANITHQALQGDEESRQRIIAKGKRMLQRFRLKFL